MTTLWLRILAFLGDREARKSLNRSAGAKRGAATRKRRSMAVKVAEPDVDGALDRLEQAIQRLPDAEPIASRVVGRHRQDAGHAAHPGFENCEDPTHYVLDPR